jgi:RNA-directed DNA polymerase
MGNSCIDLGLSNIWQSYFKFKKGKKLSQELENFNYYLEENLRALHRDLNSGEYKHGQYRKFVVTDNKRREISVARIRDRVVHRLIYEYLCGIFDKTFIFDAWSCRKTRVWLAQSKERKILLAESQIVLFGGRILRNFLIRLISRFC